MLWKFIIDLSSVTYSPASFPLNTYKNRTSRGADQPFLRRKLSFLAEAMKWLWVKKLWSYRLPFERISPKWVADVHATQRYDNCHYIQSARVNLVWHAWCICSDFSYPQEHTALSIWSSNVLSHYEPTVLQFVTVDQTKRWLRSADFSVPWSFAKITISGLWIFFDPQYHPATSVRTTTLIAVMSRCCLRDTTWQMLLECVRTWHNSATNVVTTLSRVQWHPSASQRNCLWHHSNIIREATS